MCAPETRKVQDMCCKQLKYIAFIGHRNSPESHPLRHSFLIYISVRSRDVCTSQIAGEVGQVVLFCHLEAVLVMCPHIQPRNRCHYRRRIPVDCRGLHSQPVTGRKLEPIHFALTTQDKVKICKPA